MAIAQHQQDLKARSVLAVMLHYQAVVSACEASSANCLPGHIGKSVVIPQLAAGGSMLRLDACFKVEQSRRSHALQLQTYLRLTLSLTECTVM